MSFNWRLLLAPREVLEYVVWHEACHLREMNHSRRFWALVAEHCPGYREQVRWLRLHGAALIQAGAEPAGIDPVSAGTAAQRIVSAIRGWQRSAPVVVVAIDGYGASGKTTLAAAVAASLGAVVIHTDDFFHAASDGDGYPMSQYYDWDALRREALAPALAGAGGRVVLVEGVSASAEALADLVTHTVFVQTPESVRLRRLHGRIAPEEWDDAWLEVEREYFSVRPGRRVRPSRARRARLSVRSQIDNAGALPEG